MSEYTKEQLEAYALSLQEQLKKYEGGSSVSSRPVMNNNQNAIVEWQLNLDKELELLHYQIRGWILKRDKKGNEEWVEPEDEEQKLLNEKGAQEMEKIIRNYLNKNTLLSNFEEPFIKQRVIQFAHRIRRFIYLNYEEFGLTTYYKQKHFEMLVMNIVDMVEAAYYRALNGGERESLTTVRQVIQQESFDSNRQFSQPVVSEQKKGFFGRMFGR